MSFRRSGYVDGLGAGLVIGHRRCYSLGDLKWRESQERGFVREEGICLAISEPGAGSACGLQTVATKNPSTGDYIVNGVKKWITNGQFSDYFTTAVKMQDGTFSLLLIDRAWGGVTSH